VYYPRPLHRQSAYAHYPLGYDVKSGGNSERLSASVLSLPMHPYLLPEDQDYVIANVLALV
jgi:dTDP-4-amino-4,6-dideoxygalactose transaminase